MVLIIGLIYLSQSLMQCTWALYTEFRYGWTPLNIGLSMFVTWSLHRVHSRVAPPRPDPRSV